MSKVVLITGSSSGFGKLAVERFAKKGWNVIATARSAQSIQDFSSYEGVLIQELDVTKESTITAAVSCGIARFGKIDVLVNNAGYGALGLFEMASDEEILAQLDVNLLGAMRVTRAVLPTMRTKKSGKIINISSIAGRVGMSGFSIYNASKFALEGFSESLKMELQDFNIDVQLIEPGQFKTGFGSALKINHGNVPDYFDEFASSFANRLEDFINNPPKHFAGNPTKVANLIFDCAAGNVRSFRNPIGLDAKLLLLLKKILPEKLLLYFMRKAISINNNHK